MADAIHKESQKRKCLIIGPFGEPGSRTRQWSDFLLEKVIGPVVQAAGYEQVNRTIDDSQPGSITNRLIQDLCEADLVIADLSELNPNVFYELALRHSIKKPFIHITMVRDEQPFKLPFDIQNLSVIKIATKTTEKEYEVYATAFLDAQKELKAQIENISHSDFDIIKLQGWHRPELHATQGGPSAAFFAWEISYSATYAQDWLEMQDKKLKEAVNRYRMDELNLPPEQSLRKGIAEYKAYDTTAGHKFDGDIYYVVDKFGDITGWGIFQFRFSPPKAIELKGSEENGKLIINVVQYPQRVVFGMLDEEVKGFEYEIKFERPPGQSILQGKIYHPDFPKVFVGSAKLKPKGYIKSIRTWE